MSQGVNVQKGILSIYGYSTTNEYITLWEGRDPMKSVGMSDIEIQYKEAHMHTWI